MSGKPIDEVVRAQFEAWAELPLDRDASGEYTSLPVKLAWASWQAALTAAQQQGAQEGAARKTVTVHRSKATGRIVSKHYARTHPNMVETHTHPAPLSPSEREAQQQGQAEYTYASTQATKCAGCGEHKHTPLRIDAMEGYVCLTCIDKKLGSLLGEFGYLEPQSTQQGGGEAEPMTGDLLPCPFCGKSNQDRWPCEWLDGSGANVIRCAWCHGAAPMNVWNRRTAPPSAPVGVGYAKRLATSLWQRHYREDAPQWEPFDDILGLLSQIDNMVSGLTRSALAQQPAAVDEATIPAWRVMPFTGSWKACDERWEVYSPDGSGGVVLASEVRSRDVADLLDALATQHQEPKS